MITCFRLIVSVTHPHLPGDLKSFEVIVVSMLWCYLLCCMYYNMQYNTQYTTLEKLGDQRFYYLQV